jgi:hypothetical protein
LRKKIFRALVRVVSISKTLIAHGAAQSPSNCRAGEKARLRSVALLGSIGYPGVDLLSALPIRVGRAFWPDAAGVCQPGKAELRQKVSLPQADFCCSFAEPC